jgi:hypothetical protein
MYYIISHDLLVWLNKKITSDLFSLIDAFSLTRQDTSMRVKIKILCQVPQNLIPYCHNQEFSQPTKIAFEERSQSGRSSL